jgi:hypothetical protein
MVEIILRTCTRTNVTNNNWKRYVPFNKKEIVLGCAASLFSAIQNLKPECPVRTKVLDDGSDTESLELIQQLAQKKGVEIDLQKLNGVGFNKSALLQFDRCRQSQAKYVYSVEDDYLHTPNSLLAMYFDIQHFEKQTQASPQKPFVALHPFDDPFTYYHTDKMSNSKVVLGQQTHWRTNTFSTNTLFTRPDVFKNYWAPFEKLANDYGDGKTDEHTTINLLWNNGIDRLGPVFLFTPIPSLALHLSYNNEPPHIDWREWWEKYRQ